MNINLTIILDSMGAAEVISHARNVLLLDGKTGMGKVEIQFLHLDFKIW
jgi:hypothetical protein